MTRRACLLIAAALWLGPSAVPVSAAEAGTETTVRGVVFSDRDGNGRRGPDEPGLGSVGVSNGREVVETDEDGRYELPIAPDQAVFVIKPRDHRFPIDELGIPRFYRLHDPQGSPEGLEFAGVEPTGPLPESVDFPLVPRREPEAFDVLLLGDTQVRDETDLGYLARDVVDRLIGVEAAFGLVLGDIAYDDLSVYPALNQLMSRVGVPWIYVHGNHDINFDAESDALSDETWERVYGPSSWSFDWGPAHFLVLDDVIYEGNPGSRSYHAGLTEGQLAFLEADLARVEPDRLVVIAMHIPLHDFDPEARRALFSRLDRFERVFVVTAHWHIQMHSFFEREGMRPIHELVQATVCGSWWLGAPDPFGLPHTTMRDGAPSGYSLLRIDGNEYAIDFLPLGLPAGNQMHVELPPFLAAEEAAGHEVLINVYAGSERSTVELRVDDGPWHPALRLEERISPRYAEILAREESLRHVRRRLPDPVPSPHLWRAALPSSLTSGPHELEVRTTDMFGREHRTTRTFVVH
jgi:hypothetical protein